MKKTDFKPGQVIEFCDEHFLVIENYGSSGVVNPIGETYYLRFFYWEFEKSVCNFVREGTEEEKMALGFYDEIKN